MPVGIISGAISAGMSIFGAIKAGREKKAAKKAMEEYERQDLKNPYASISRLPNEALAMQNEMSARGLANATQVARTSNRGFAALPGATQAYEDSVRQTAAMAEQYGLQREQLIAQGEAYRQDMMERREEADIAGLANEYAVADQNLRNDLVSLGTSVVSGLSAASDQFGWLQPKGDPYAGNVFNAGSPMEGRRLGNLNSQVINDVTLDTGTTVPTGPVGLPYSSGPFPPDILNNPRNRR